MRKLISNLFITLDGVVEAPNEWSLRYWNDEIQEAVAAGMASSDAMLLGRVTYEEFAAAWAGRTTEDDAGADHMNTTRKYVVSSTLTETPWGNSTLLTGDPFAAIADLKASDGQDIMTSGSATLVRGLLQHGLVDELHLLVYPIVRGRGARLFSSGDPQLELALAEAKTFTGGVLSLAYSPAERAA